MPPGSTELIEAAAKSGHGWEAVAIAIFFIVLIATVWLMNKVAISREDAATRSALAREDRLAARVTTLETSMENNLIKLVKETTEAVSRNSDAWKQTSEVMTEVKAALITNTRETTRVLSKLESSACCLSSMGLLSPETERRIEETKRAAAELIAKSEG